MGDAFDPYYQWLGIPRKDQPPNYYRLLGIELYESDAGVIKSAASRQSAHVRTFETGPYAVQSAAILKALATVEASLLDPQRKAAYDQALRARLSGPSPAQSFSAQVPARESSPAQTSATQILEAESKPQASKPQASKPPQPSTSMASSAGAALVPSAVKKPPVRQQPVAELPPAIPPVMPDLPPPVPISVRSKLPLIGIVAGAASLTLILLSVAGWFAWSWVRSLPSQPIAEKTRTVTPVHPSALPASAKPNPVAPKPSPAQAKIQRSQTQKTTAQKTVQQTTTPKVVQSTGKKEVPQPAKPAIPAVSPFVEEPEDERSK